MAYGTIKVDTITFTDAGVDKSVTISGLVQNPTFSGNITVTGTVSGNTIQGQTVSGATITGGAAAFTTVTGGVATITSGVFALGSASNPSISFTGDANTGLYSPGADQVAISTAGSGRLFVDASGNVGVGGSPDQKLTVVGNIKGVNGSGQGIQFVNTATPYIQALGTSNINDLQISAQTIQFQTGTTYSTSERLRITSAGLVGVGTSSPGDTLQINKTGAGGVKVVSTTQSTIYFSNAAATGGYIIGRSIGSDDAHNLFSYDATNSHYVDYFEGGSSGYRSFYTNGTERLRIDSSGNVGIGTSNPTARLTVAESASSSDAQIYLRNSAGGAVGGVQGTRINFYNDVGFPDATPSAYIQSRGNDGGVNGESSLRFGVYNGSGTPSIEAMRINAQGRVGIGTTSPGYLLDVAGSARIKTGATGTPFIVSTGSDSQGTLRFGSASNEYSISSGADYLGMIFNVNAGEAARIDSSGRLGIGTSSPAQQLEVQDGSIQIRNSTTLSQGSLSPYGLTFRNANQLGQDRGTIATIKPYLATAGDNDFGLQFQTQATTTGGVTTKMTLTPGGSLGIGTTSPQSPLCVSDNNANTIEIRPVQSDIIAFNRTTSQWGNLILNSANNIFQIQGGEVGRFDNSGRLLVGTSSASGTNTLFESSSTTANAANVALVKRNSGTADQAGQQLHFYNFGPAGTARAIDTEVGSMRFYGSQPTSGAAQEMARITCAADLLQTGANTSGRLVFSTTADGASSPTERMRIPSDGSILLGKTSADDTVQGAAYAGGRWNVTTLTAAPLLLNRQNDDGDVVIIRQANTTEGTISVSGTTVSYNGAHLSRWSQLPSGAERIEILRGSVLSNIDEMCEWGNEDNEQLNRMKVSDVEGDKNVSGVFQAWDDDDDTYTNDFYCAMTGDFIIRIAQGVTVERGDLLMSAGDGTAKPQADDLVRSCTVAKVTSTNVSCTYADGSYCVPCVLMAC